MAKLSRAAWILHELGLATSIGGTMYGRSAMQPALRSVSEAQERDRVADLAWRRFNRMNLAAHGAMAATWFVGRQMLTGGEVSGRARSMVRAKDALVVASLATGIASALLGRALGRRVEQQRGPASESETDGGGRREVDGARGLHRAVSAVGNLNLLANAGILAVTTMLSMESAQSTRFAPTSRELP